MNEILKIVILAIVLFVFLVLFIPKSQYPREKSKSVPEPLAKSEEGFVGNDINILGNSTEYSLSKRSTLVYADPLLDSDKKFNDKYYNSKLDEPLIMYRCIEFNEGGIDSVISMMRNQKAQRCI